MLVVEEGRSVNILMIVVFSSNKGRGLVIIDDWMGVDMVLMFGCKLLML